jgi:hypothetical protein
MAARNGMSTLIRQVRQMTNAGTVDYTIAGTAYWTDDQVQEVLDSHRLDINFEMMKIEPSYVAVSPNVEYHTYCTNWGSLEQPTTTGGTVFAIQTSDGTEKGTALYTGDWNRGVFVFTADQKGIALYMTGRSYDVNAAAAEIWGQKAAQYGMAYDVSTDNHSLKRSQMIAQALLMAQFYASRARLGSIPIGRSDDVPARRKW